MQKDLNKIKNQDNKNAIVIYKDGKDVRIDVRLDQDTIWLTQAQIALLFGSERSVITKHIQNVFKDKELNENSVCAKIAHTATDGKKYITTFYNLDVILSVGYRVNSIRATDFRIWATKTLKNYLLKGYVINKKLLLETKEKFKELQSTVTFLQEKSKKELLVGQEVEILNLLATYAKTLTILDEYDKGELKEAKGVRGKFVLTYEKCLEIIMEIKKELVVKKEASSLFANERGGVFGGIIKGLYQTFDGKELYQTLEKKAAHLLYLIIKDHPFFDGNKRTASFLFVYFLEKNDALYLSNGEKKINNNTLVALALLVAESRPEEKEQMIALMTQLLK